MAVLSTVARATSGMVALRCSIANREARPMSHDALGQTSQRPFAGRSKRNVVQWTELHGALLPL
eukprot:COSAG02_NODE_2198_length_9544_cov_30.739121_7_plen_64_part_00